MPERITKLSLRMRFDFVVTDSMQLRNAGQIANGESGDRGETMTEGEALLAIAHELIESLPFEIPGAESGGDSMTVTAVRQTIQQMNRLPRDLYRLPLHTS